VAGYIMALRRASGMARVGAVIWRVHRLTVARRPAAR
jgi:hypothetical protein